LAYLERVIEKARGAAIHRMRLFINFECQGVPRSDGPKRGLGCATFGRTHRSGPHGHPRDSRRVSRLSNDRDKDEAQIALLTARAPGG
jgi:hypothetical protein